MKQLYLQKVEEIKMQEREREECARQRSEERGVMESLREKVLQ
jgi:hypothetical protein